MTRSVSWLFCDDVMVELYHTTSVFTSWCPQKVMNFTLNWMKVIFIVRYSD